MRGGVFRLIAAVGVLAASAPVASAQSDWGSRIRAAAVTSEGAVPTIEDLTGARHHPSTRVLGYLRRCTMPLPDSVVIAGRDAAADRIYVAYRAGGQPAISPVRRPGSDTITAEVVGVACGESPVSLPRVFLLRWDGHELVYDAGPLSWYGEQEFPLLRVRLRSGSLSPLVWDPLARRMTTRDHADAWYGVQLARAVEQRVASDGEPEALVRALLQGRVVPGMAPGHVREVLGPPDRVNRTTTAAGASEQWVYDAPTRYVYLEGGRVTAVQD